ncbi:MAG: hypothetical protein HQL29_03965 [Candidatus Omnitrophica bacterium]|nr:hypothetical protein [Candidatus Omnitrophota bacterium]
MARKWKEYLRNDLKNGMFETGILVRDLQTKVREFSGRNKINKEAEKTKLSDEVKSYITIKSVEFLKKPLNKKDLEKISKEVFELIRCSLASDRTPDEIYEGLKDDPEMREEVIAMLIKGAEAGITEKKQKVLLEGIFSGDEDLKVLLNKKESMLWL